MHRQTAFIKNDLDAKVYIKATGNRTLVDHLKKGKNFCVLSNFITEGVIY